MKRLFLALALLAIGPSPLFAEVSNLVAVHRAGQTFLTFRESSPTATYRVYRSNAPIATVAGLEPIAALEADSGTNRYTKEGFVICDLCAPLSPDTGLLVWTPGQNGTAYYAVSIVGESAFAVTGPVAETRARVPGAVLLGTTPNVGGGSHTQYRYYAWEDFAAWRTADWGYYGHRFDVYVPEAVWGMPAPRPLVLSLHAAGTDNTYVEPGWYVQSAIGVVIHPVDMSWTNGGDPYAGPYFHSKWFGRLDPVTGLKRTITEDRLVRYVQFVRDTPLFGVDPNRVYVRGASLGAGAMHLASHHPTIFAAARASIGWINDDAWAGSNPANTTTRVNQPDGPLWADYQDMAWMAANADLVPIVHTFNKDDRTIRPDAYPAALLAFEAHKQPYAARWQNGNHLEFYLDGAWDYQRFKKNEAYPAFGNATNSSPAAAQVGQRNADLDWSSELHLLGGGTEIVDTTTRFEMTFKSLSSMATADVTIRNTQEFRPAPNQAVVWRNRSASGEAIEGGTVPADANGRITVRLRILADGNRLTLECDSCLAVQRLEPPRPPTNIRLHVN